MFNQPFDTPSTFTSHPKTYNKRKPKKRMIKDKKEGGKKEKPHRVVSRR